MALLDFPTGPNTNDTTTQNGNTWKWNGTSWVAFNNLSLSTQVSGILGTLYGGTGKALSGLTVGSVLYADTSTSFAALAPSTNNYVLATQGDGNPPYWKIDDSGTGSVGSGSTGGFSYYTGLNTVTSGTAFSYIVGPGAGGTGGTVILTSSTMALIGSTITAGTWAGSAITLTYGGTNGTNSGIALSNQIAVYNNAGMAITQILSSSGTANSILLQASQNVTPQWVSQSTLLVGSATTAAGVAIGSTTDTRYLLGTSSSGAASNAAFSTGSGITIGNNRLSSGSIYLSDSTTSSSTSTGALVVVGGVGIGGSLNTASGSTSAISGVTHYNGSIIGGTWAGTAITLLYGGTNGINSGIALSNQLAVYNNAGNAITQILSSAGTANSILLQASQNVTPQWVSQSTLLVGSATTAAGVAIGSTTDTRYLLGTSSSGAASNAAFSTGSGITIGNNRLTATDISATNFYGSGANLTSVVNSVSSGTGILVSGSTGTVSITNIGVTALTSGDVNRVTVGGSGGTGSVTVNLPNTVIVNNIQLDGGASTLTTVGLNPTNIVNKQYVDNLASGLDIHASVRAVQYGSAIGGSYVQSQLAGSAATNAYIISTTQIALPSIDGVSFTATGSSQRILIAGGATGRTSINGSAFTITPTNTAIANGIYYVGAVGSGSSNWILVRAADTDDSTELNGGTFVFVEEGTVYKDTGFVCTNDTTNSGPIQFGLDSALGAINFSPFSGAAALSAGQGIAKIGNTLATKVNLSSSFAASAIGFTQFNIGGAGDAGVADTGYYPTFSVKTDSVHAGTALLTINHTGFSLAGSTNTAATLTVTGNISLPNPGAAGRVAYSSDTNTMAFVGGTAEQILKSNGSSAPSFVNQSTLIVGGATTAAQWQTSRTVTFSGGGVTGSFSINGSADVSSVNLNIADDAVALGTKTTGNYATSVAGAGNGLSTIGTAGEGTAFTVHSNATSANTVSTLVFRDGSGNFSAGTITATLSGTATSANAWTSGRTVTFSGGGVTGSFSINGSADVSSVNLNIADDAVALGTKTTGNYATSVAGAGNGLSTIGTAGEGTAFTVHSNATDTNTNSTLVFRNSSGNFSAGTITANLTGTASIASSAAALSLVSDTTNTLYLLGHRTASGAASSQVYVDTSISISGPQITAGVWAGTAISLANGGTNNTVAGNGHSSKVAVYNAAGTSITAYTHPQGSVIFGATGGTYAGLASTLLPVVGIGSNPPAPAAAIGATQAGQLWWDSEYGVLKIYYSDQGVGVTVNSQWVDATPVLGSSGGASSTKRSYVMSFGAGFTPTAGADTVQIQIPYAPDNTSKYYYIKRLDYRNETLSGGTGASFFIERFTGGNAAFTSPSRIFTAGAGAGSSFVIGASTYTAGWTLAATGASFVSSSGVAGSVISGDYMRLNFTTVGSAAAVSISMIVEEQ
jgi:hypothetical protein